MKQSMKLGTASKKVSRKEITMTDSRVPTHLKKSFSIIFQY